MNETLYYWNLRAVEARLEYIVTGSKVDREDLTFCRRMVVLVERGVFRKDVL